MYICALSLKRLKSPNAVSIEAACPFDAALDFFCSHRNMTRDQVREAPAEFGKTLVWVVLKGAAAKYRWTYQFKVISEDAVPDTSGDPEELYRRK